MASIDTGSTHGGKKSVDASIPLVPFIDLLLCCVMFLLVTAVWNELSAVNVAQRTPGDATVDTVPTDDIQLQVQLSATGYVVSTTAGDSVQIPRIGEQLDVASLRERLAALRTAYPNRRDITVASDDDVRYEALIATMDAVRASGFGELVM